MPRSIGQFTGRLLLHCVETTLKNHESGILRKFVGYLKKAEVVLCDRGYCSYANLGLLLNHQMDAVMRLHQRHKCDFRSGQTLGRYDRLVTWKKPQRQHGFSPEEWAQLPAELTLRMVRFFVQIKGFRTRKIDLVTPLYRPPPIHRRGSGRSLLPPLVSGTVFSRHKTTMKMETYAALLPKWCIRKSSCSLSPIISSAPSCNTPPPSISVTCIGSASRARSTPFGSTAPL